MFFHYRTKGFFLKKQDKGEADQLFTVYTKDYGRIEVLGRGIRRIKSKLRSGVQSFYFSDIEFIQGKNYKTLTDAILIDRLPNLRKNLYLTEIAFRIGEIFNKLPLKKDKDVWLLIEEVFASLDNKELPFSQKILCYYYFLWNFFAVLGYKPELNCCVVCEKKLNPNALYFNVQEGGLLGDCCKDSDSFEISEEAAKIIRIFFSQKLPKLKVSLNHLKELKTVSSRYLGNVLGRENDLL